MTEEEATWKVHGTPVLLHKPVKKWRHCITLCLMCRLCISRHQG